MRAWLASPPIRSVGMGKSSRTVHRWPWSRTIYQPCRGVTVVVCQLGSSRDGSASGFQDRQWFARLPGYDLRRWALVKGSTVFGHAAATSVNGRTPAHVKVAGWKTPGLLRAVTGGVVPLPLGGPRCLTRCRCLLCLLAGQAALTPSANPSGKSGLHHAHLPLFRGRAMAGPAGRVAAPPADPGL